MNPNKKNCQIELIESKKNILLENRFKKYQWIKYTEREFLPINDSLAPTLVPWIPLLILKNNIEALIDNINFKISSTKLPFIDQWGTRMKNITKAIANVKDDFHIDSIQLYFATNTPTK